MLKDCCWRVTPQFQELLCTAHRRYANGSHPLSTWGIRTGVNYAHFIDEASDLQIGPRTCPRSYSWKRQSWDSHQGSLNPMSIHLCIALLATICPIQFSTASPHTPLFSLLTYPLQTCLVLCHFHSFPHGSPQFFGPLQKSTIPQGSAMSTVPLKSYCLWLLPTRHFYCHLTAISLHHLSSSPPKCVAWGQKLCTSCLKSAQLL